MPTIDITLPPGTTQSTLDNGSKETVYTGTTIAIDDPANDENDYTTPLNVDGTGTGEIKGRGNYTWNLAKKPYQFKLDGSKDVLGMGAAKTWILLANHADASLMRNKVAYDLGADPRAVRLPRLPLGRPADQRPVPRATTCSPRRSRSRRTASSSPTTRASSWSSTAAGTARRPATRPRTSGSTARTSGSTFTLKDAKPGVPDPDDGESMNDAEFAGDQGRLGRHEGHAQPARLPPVSEQPQLDRDQKIIDVDSFVKYYFVFELAENPEIVSSSVFFYKDGPERQAVRRAGVGLRQRAGQLRQDRALRRRLPLGVRQERQGPAW